MFRRLKRKMWFSICFFWLLKTPDCLLFFDLRNIGNMAATEFQASHDVTQGVAWVFNEEAMSALFISTGSLWYPTGGRNSSQVGKQRSPARRRKRGKWTSFEQAARFRPFRCLVLFCLPYSKVLVVLIPWTSFDRLSGSAH